LIEFLLITAVILLLYGRTWDYCKLIDDPVPREGYLWEGPRKPHYSFYDEKRQPMAFVTNIGVHIATCLAIQLCFGWQVALLFAVIPTNVSGVAWSTGNYYMTTVLFVVTAYYFATLNTWWGTILAGVFYFSALHSTISAIPFAFLMACLGNFWMFIPLIAFMTGKRFRYGLKSRKEKHDEMGVVSGEVKLDRFFVVIKTIGYYIFLNCWPKRLGFFHEYCKKEQFEGKLPKPSKLFYMNVGICSLFATLAWLVDPFIAMWWFLFIGIFSQFTTFGQFVAERYTYIANIAFCMLVAALVGSNTVVLAVIATLWFCRSLEYIPAWKHNKDLFYYSIKHFPACAENYVNVSSYYLERKEWRHAINPLVYALKNAQGDKTSIHYNLSSCYEQNMQFDLAVKHCEEAHKTCTKDRKTKIYFEIIELRDKARKTRSLRKKMVNAFV